MRSARAGDRVRATKPHSGVRKGTKGKVISRHTGLYYGVAYGPSIVYSPATHVEPDADEKGGPSDHDADDAPVTAAQEWATAMAILTEMCE